jgi:hypothetical protein
LNNNLLGPASYILDKTLLESEGLKIHPSKVKAHFTPQFQN